MTIPVLICERDAVGVLEITLNRPGSANTINLEMARALCEVAQRCESDRSLKAVVLTGAGERFCAGGDLRSFADAGDALPTALRELTLHLHGALLSFARMDAPLIVAVNGVAAGAGLSLAAASDVCIVARSATFRSAYTAIGLSPDGGSTFWLPRLIGMRRAQEMILTNMAVDAARALSWGLATEVVDDGAALGRARAVAASVAALSTRALGASRRLLLESSQSELAEQLDREARSVVDLAGEESVRATIRAFVTRPRPA